MKDSPVSDQTGEFFLRDLSQAVIRSNPQYRFDSFKALSEMELRSLGIDSENTAFVGILRNTGSGELTMKAVSLHTASLFNKLRVAHSVHCILEELGRQERDRILAELVLEGILEIEVDGVFASQYAACPMLVHYEEESRTKTRLATLSIRAIKHAQRRGVCNVKSLADQMYLYHRLPVTSWARTLWPDANAVMRFIGLPSRQGFPRNTLPGFEMSVNSRWLSWRAKADRSNSSDRPSRYKLYISPSPLQIPKAFMEVAAALQSQAAAGLKLGSNAHDLMRCDKFIVYFDCYRELFLFAEALTPRLDGLSAHGVPFTAPIDESGILSWAIDPPGDEVRIGWYEDDSWRLWICNRLALALASAMKNSEPKMAPWRYALARLWLAGIDTDTWILRQKVSRDTFPNVGISSEYH